MSAFPVCFNQSCHILWKERFSMEEVIQLQEQLTSSVHVES